MATRQRQSRKRSATWWASLALAAFGLVVASYLTWIKLADQTAACGGIGDCESVNNSRYATIAGIPIALLGAGAYLVILVLLALQSRLPQQDEMLRLVVFGLTLAGTLYSAYLTYLELAVLKAICPYCVASAVAMTLLLVLSAVRLRASAASSS